MYIACCYVYSSFTLDNKVIHFERHILVFYAVVTHEFYKKDYKMVKTEFTEWDLSVINNMDTECIVDIKEETWELALYY